MSISPKARRKEIRNTFTLTALLLAAGLAAGLAYLQHRGSAAPAGARGAIAQGHGAVHRTAPERSGMSWPRVTVERGLRLPVAKEGIALAAGHSHVESVGGYTGGYSTDTVFDLNPFSTAPSAVHQTAVLPQPTHDAAAGYIGSDLYIFGGGQAQSYNTVLSVHQGRVRSLAPLARPLSDASAVPWSQGGRKGLVVLGGYDGQAFNTVARFYWERQGVLESSAVFRMPAGLRYTAAAADASGICWAGGLTASGQPSPYVYRWQPGRGVKRIARLPVALQKAAAFLEGPYLVVAGGEDERGLARREIWAVRLGDGRVRRIGELPMPLADMGYAQTGRTGVLLGGTDGHRMSAFLYRLTFESARGDVHGPSSQ